jgi:hypothetical protein
LESSAFFVVSVTLVEIAFSSVEGTELEALILLLNLLALFETSVFFTAELVTPEKTD